MNRTILYYPTINIPTDNWLRHALLYWDEVSSIVPKSWDENLLIELSPEIHYLMEEEQFRPIKPETLISGQGNWEIFQEFENEFTEIVSSPRYQTFINYQNGGLHYNFSRIHRNKTSDLIFHFLEQRGLAILNNHDEWLHFESNTALLYMSLLAKYLADIDGNHTTIGTDYLSYERFNFKKVTESKGFPVISLSLDKVLPTPKDNVSFEKIIKFKRKRVDNLRHFKKTISDFQIKVSNSSSQGELKETAIDFSENLLNGVDDLSKALSDSKIDCSFKSFKSLINLQSPTTLLTVGATINSKIDLINLPINLTAIGIGAVGAVELASNYIDSKNHKRAKLRESPFSYVYHAHRNGIINRWK